MEAATVPEQDTTVETVERVEQDTRPQEAAATGAAVVEMFKFSGYVHIGAGAETCEHREDGQCADPEHFHAWCRTPNKLQYADIYKKAAAARARVMRQLRDESSDRRAVIEADLEEIRESGSVEALIDDLIRPEWGSDYLAAMIEVGDEEEFEHIDQDREEFERLTPTQGHLPDSEQTEEFRELTGQVARWVEAVGAALDRIQQPKREALRERGVDALIGLVRDLRIKEIAETAFSSKLAEWTWFIGTLKVDRHPTTNRPFKRMWTAPGTIDDAEPGTMWGASPEEIEIIEATYAELNAALRSGTRGNS